MSVTGYTKSGADAKFVQVANSAPLAQAGQTPSQAPVAPGTSAVGALAFTARADHVHPSAGVYGFYGDGSDGTLVLDGTSTVAGFTRSGTTYSATGVIFANNLTINAGVTLQPQQFSIYVLGTLTNNGHISGDGLASAGTAAGGVIQAASGWYLNLPGLGAAGGTGAGATGQLTRTPTNANPPSQAQFGGGGGAGGAGASGAAGAATAQSGTTIFGSYPFARMIKAAQLAFLGVVPLMHSATGMDTLWGGNGGSAGGGDGTNSGGGGGGGGTPVLLNARVIVNAGTITANGGNGGTPPTGNCGGGGGGGAGPILINTTSLSGAGTVTANGGAAGAAVGTGGVGAAGSAAYVQTTVWA